MIDLKDKSTFNLTLFVIFFFVVLLYQIVKKDNPQTLRFLGDKLKSNKIEGVVIKTIYSKRLDLFKAQIYNSEKKVKYTIDEWLLKSPENLIKVNDSISKKSNSLEYVIFRKQNSMIDTIKLIGDLKNVKLKD